MKTGNPGPWPRWRYRYVAGTLALAATLALIACDDGGSGEPPTLDGDVDASFAYDGGPPPGSDATVIVPGQTPFAIVRPLAGAVLAGRATVQVAAQPGAVARFTVRLGDRELGAAAAADGLQVGFPVTDLPAGEQELLIQLFDGDDQPVAAVTHPVQIVPNPPAEAVVPPSGGALQTPAGVVVIVPPGALEAPTGLRVQDRRPGDLPRFELEARGIAPGMAIDFMPQEGPADPTFRLRHPAIIQFPWPPPGGQKQSVGSPDTLGAIGSSGETVEATGTVVVSGGYAIAGDPEGMAVFAVRNLTRPDQPLQAMDVVALVGARFPALPDELRVTVPGLPPLRPSVAPGGDQVVLLLPPGAVGDPVTLTLEDRVTGQRLSVPLQVGARPAPELDVAQADALIDLYFDQLEGALGRLANDPFEGGPRVQSAGAARDRLEAELGAPMAFWIAAIGELRAEIAALTDAERIALAGPLETLPTNLSLMAGASLDQISDDDLCLSFLILQGMAKYWSVVLGVVPTGLVAKLALKTVGLFFDSSVAAFDQAFQAGACAEAFRRRGLIKYECDFLAFLEEQAEEEEKDSTLEGQVRGVGTRAPSFIGISFQGITSDLPGVFLPPATLGSVRAFEAGTNTAAALLDAVVFPDGTFTLPFLANDTSVDLWVDVPGLDEPYVIPNVPTPPADETWFLPVFVPLPDLEPIEPGAPISVDDFQSLAGDASGLLEDRSSRGVTISDVDGDGAWDLEFHVGPSPISAEDNRVGLAYVARQVEGARFEALIRGALPLEATNDLPLLATSVHDVNGDGRLDRVGLVQQGLELKLTALLAADALTDHTLAELLVVPAETPGDSFGGLTGLAWGDFVPGGALELVAVSAPFDPAQPLAPQDGFVALYELQDGALVETARVPRVARPGLVPEQGTVGDLDGDGRVDAVFPRLGVVVFGEADGAFTPVELPANCALGVDGAGAGDLRHRAAWLDGGDGGLGLLIARRERDTPLCWLRADEGRALQAGAPPAPLTLPAAPRSVLAADLDLDGRDELIVIDVDDRMHVQRATDAGFEAGPRSMVDEVADVAVVDLSGDGRPDLALARQGRQADALLVSGLELVGGAVQITTAGVPGVTLRVDLDGDGQPDRLLRSGVEPVTVAVPADGTVTVEAAFATGTVQSDPVGAGALLELSPP